MRNYIKEIKISNGVYRIIDANINRAKEGLRVCEEITRFILNNRSLTSELKKIRHKIGEILQGLSVNKQLLRDRESLKDAGRTIYAGEIERKGCQDIFFANMQRAKESLRVLEEFSKLINKSGAIEFKKLRYALYELEKRLAEKIPALSYCR